MKGRIESGQLCTVAPVDPATLSVGDIALCKVGGHEFLHIVKAIDGARFQIGTAVRSQRMFNLMRLASGIKVDLIVRKDSEYRRVEFARRQPVNLAGVATWITAREDLILSKLVWGRDADSELQKRDVRTLLDDTVDWQYLKEWAPKLGVAEILDNIAK